MTVENLRTCQLRRDAETGAVVLTIHYASRRDHYRVEPGPGPSWRLVRLTFSDEETAVFLVLLGERPRCGCCEPPTGDCEHIQALTVLAAAGRLKGGLS